MARRDRDSQYGGGSYKSSSNKSTRSQSYGGGDNNRENYRTSTTYQTSVSKTLLERNKQQLEQDRIKKQMQDFANYTYQPPNTISPVVNLIAGFVGEKGFEVNKAYYTKNVIGKTNPVTGKAYAGSIEDFKTYMTGRSSGTLDAMGRSMPTTSRRDDRRIVTQVQKTAVSQSPAGPTDAEVSQSSSTDAAQDTLLVKKRGRRQTILTDPQGLGGTATVTKKKLLG
jgi:hypothetical protein